MCTGKALPKYTPKSKFDVKLVVKDTNFLNEIRLASARNLKYQRNRISGNAALKKGFKERGVLVEFMDGESSRAKLNRTRINQNVIYWTLELVIQDKITIVVQNVNEETCIEQVVSNLQAHFKLVGVPKTGECILNYSTIESLSSCEPKANIVFDGVPVTGSLKSILANKKVLEYPKFVVV